ncbi:hypothetical protein SDRG_01703, partial [Saprolegnia diclina VS20]
MSHAYSVLQERSLGAATVACCPTMDIVAVLTTDDHLLVYRTVSWQRLLHVTPSDVESPMTVLAWRPDGLVLAVGHANGKIVLYDMETGEATMQLFGKVHAWEHTQAISALHWAAAGAAPSTHRLEDRTSRCVMNPPSESSTETAAKFTTVPALDDSRHILASGDTSGTILLWALGSVCIRRLQPAGVQSVTELHLLSDLSALLIGSQEDSSRQILSLALPDLPTHQGQLFVVSHHVREVQKLLHTLDTTLKQLTTEWTNGTRVLEAKMRLLSSAYAKYSSFEVPQAHMYTLLCAGLGFPALTNFFAQDMQEQSLQRIQKAFFHACHSMQTLIHEQLRVAACNVLFRLCELRGLTSTAPSHRPASVAHLSTMIAMVEVFLLKLEQLQIALRETELDYALLFRWFGAIMAAHGTARPKAATKLSLPDTKRLGRFLFRATTAAKVFRAHCNSSQSVHDPANGFEMEVTFGNPVAEMLGKCPWKTSPRLEASTSFALDGEDQYTSHSLVALCAAIEATWRTQLLSENGFGHPLGPPTTPLLVTASSSSFEMGELASAPLLLFSLDGAIGLGRRVQGSWHMAVLRLPPSHRLMDQCLYSRDGQSQLALLHATGSEQRLSLVALASITFAPPLTASTWTRTALQSLEAQEVPTFRKQRVLSTANFDAVVGDGVRGVLGVISIADRRLMLFDAEDDEEDDEDDEMDE